MAGSVNKVILVGNLGNDPDVRATHSGKRVVSLRVATSESWRDKNTGERKDRTEWHRVVIYGDGLASVAEKYLRKGSKVYIEGQLQTREWEKDGQKHYSTEVVLQGFGAALHMLDGGKPRDDGAPQQPGRDYQAPIDRGQAKGYAAQVRDEEPEMSFDRDLNDEIPF